MTRLLDTTAALAVLAACLCANAPVLLVALVLIATALVGAKEYRPWRCELQERQGRVDHTTQSISPDSLSGFGGISR